MEGERVTLLSQFVSMVLGGQHKIRPLWRHYFTGCAGLLYVIDSADNNRFEESREELSWIVEDQEMKGKHRAPHFDLVVFASQTRNCF